MPKILARVGVALLALIAVACDDEQFGPDVAQSSPGTVEAKISGSPGDRAAIQEIVNTFDRSWGVDAATYAAQYASADFVGPTGQVLTTAEEILELYTNIFPAFAGTTRRSQIRALTFVTPWQPGITRALEKNILSKRGGEWRIVQHQQVLVAPGVE